MPDTYGVTKPVIPKMEMAGAFGYSTCAGKWSISHTGQPGQSLRGP